MLRHPTRVFEFDFTKDMPATAEESFQLTPHSDGIAHEIAFWFDLQLSPENVLSTPPSAPSTHWRQAVYTLPQPMEIKQNEPVRLFASHDQNKITLTLGN